MINKEICNIFGTDKLHLMSSNVSIRLFNFPDAENLYFYNIDDLDKTLFNNNNYINNVLILKLVPMLLDFQDDLHNNLDNELRIELENNIFVL